MPFLCFSFLSFFIYFYSTQNTCTSNRTHISYVFSFSHSPLYHHDNNHHHDDDAYNNTTTTTTTTTTRPNATTTTSGANGTRDATASRVPGIFLFFFFFSFCELLKFF